MFFMLCFVANSNFVLDFTLFSCCVHPYIITTLTYPQKLITLLTIILLTTSHNITPPAKNNTNKTYADVR